MIAPMKPGEQAVVLTIERGQRKETVTGCRNCKGHVRLVVECDAEGLTLGAGHTIPWCEWFKAQTDPRDVADGVGWRLAGIMHESQKAEGST